MQCCSINFPIIVLKRMYIRLLTSTLNDRQPVVSYFIILSTNTKLD